MILEFGIVGICTAIPISDMQNHRNYSGGEWLPIRAQLIIMPYYQHRGEQKTWKGKLKTLKSL
jgi:hypothetical protein